MVIERMIQWYERYERPLSSVSLIGGFVFDAITLKRVDMFWENLWVLAHLILAAIGILLLNFYEQKRGNNLEQTRIHFWLLIVIQFSFGGLLSTFLVFYFRSATLSNSWPFILLLVIAFICNESFKKHYTRLTFQIVMLYISIFSFAIFIIPVIVHRIGALVFLLSGLVSLISLGIFIWLLRYASHEKFKESWKRIIISTGFIFVIVNILYFTHLIPPLPLSLKESIVYHSIQRSNTGLYEGTFEPRHWFDFFRRYERLHLTTGSPAYIYTAIFSPTNLNVSIIHEWQHYNESTNSWETRSTIPLSIAGGREEGFRTYSLKNNLEAGKWRVNVKTPQGQLLGREKFIIEQVDIGPILETEVK